MKKLQIHRIGRFLIVVTLVWTLNIPTLGGVLEVGASAISPESQSKNDNQAAASAKNKTYNDTDNAWVYSGHWSKDKVRRAVGGQIHTSSAIEDEATISITGARFTLVYSTAPNYGEVDVFVDDLKIDTINQQKSKTSHQKEWDSPEFALGTHIIKFVHVSGKMVNIDAIKVRGPKTNPDPRPTDVPTSTATPILFPSDLPGPTESPFPTETSIVTLSPTPTDFVPVESPTSLPQPQPTPSPTPFEVVPQPSPLTPFPVLSPTATATSSPVFPPTVSFTATVTPTSIQTATPSQTPSPTVPIPTPTASTTTITVSPGESIQTKCVNAASTGATCEVSSGTYSERVMVSRSVSLICKGSCLVTGGFDITASNVILRGFEVTTRGIRAKGQYNLIENNYVHDLTSEEGILLYDGLNTNHLTIRNNRIVRANNVCIFLAGHNHLMEGNDCSYTKQPSPGDADCFRYFGGNHILRGNYCHDIWYGAPGYDPSVGDYVDDAHIDCFQTWNWGSQGGSAHDSLIEKNVCDLPSQGVHEQSKGFEADGVTSSGAIDLTRDFPCRNLTFRNNVIHSNLLAIFNYCQNITIVNNTFVGDVGENAQGLHLLPLQGTNIIQYNIFVNQEKDAAITSYSAETDPTIVGGYNLTYRSNGVPIGTPQPGDLWDVDPQFVNPAAGDYRLQPGSPACGFGAYPCQ